MSEKKLWNVVSSSGFVINEIAIEGTKEQAETYMKIMYDHCKLEPFKPRCLDDLEFEKSNEIILCKYKGSILVNLAVDNDTVAILDDDHSLVDRLSIDKIRLFKNFNNVDK